MPVLKYLLIGLAWLAICSVQASADRHTATISGTVSLDRDRNGRLDPGEPGIPEVCVSNGLDNVDDDLSLYHAISS